jgi:hypothetical protein
MSLTGGLPTTQVHLDPLRSQIRNCRITGSTAAPSNILQGAITCRQASPDQMGALASKPPSAGGLVARERARLSRSNAVATLSPITCDG